MSNINRRAILTGAASAAVAAPAFESDPIFAAIEAYKRNDAAFHARCRYEDGLGVKLVPAAGDYRTSEMAALVDACIAARIAIAETAPTTPAGLAALTGFLREQTTELDDGPFFLDEQENVAFVTTLDRAVRGIAERCWGGR